MRVSCISFPHRHSGNSVEPGASKRYGVQLTAPTSRAYRRGLDFQPICAPRHVEFELNELDCTVRICLRAHSDQAITEAPLQGPKLLPLQPIHRVSGRLRLRNNVSSHALPPVIIVTLRAGNIELSLASFKKRATCVKKGIEAFVDCNLNRNST